MCVSIYIYIYIYIQKLTNEITSFLQIFSNYIFMILEPGSWFKAMGASCWWRDYWGCNNTTLKCSAWVAQIWWSNVIKGLNYSHWTLIDVQMRWLKLIQKWAYPNQKAKTDQTMASSTQNEHTLTIKSSFHQGLSLIFIKLGMTIFLWCFKILP